MYLRFIYNLICLIKPLFSHYYIRIYMNEIILLFNSKNNKCLKKIQLFSMTRTLIFILI